MSISQVITAITAWYVIERFQIYGLVGSLILNIILLFLASYLVLFFKNKKYLVSYNLKEVLRWLLISVLSIVLISILPDIFIVFNLTESVKINFVFEIFFKSLITCVLIIIGSYITKLNQFKTFIRLLKLYGKAND